MNNGDELRGGSFLDTKEWYDNHRTGMILNCPRKAWYHIVGPQALVGLPSEGLSHGVGDGANFGTCIHAAWATYYGYWHTYSEPRRRLLALTRYREVWNHFFANRGPELLKPHSCMSGVSVLQDYFDRYVHEDKAYEPLDPELSFAVEIDPAKYGLPGIPFWYVGRTDGVFKRRFDGDRVVNEYKTTGSGVSRRLKSLKRSRQGRGYVACLRMVPEGQRITGFLGVVVLVAADKREADRAYFPVSQLKADLWIRQTITIVNSWRYKLRLVEEGADPLVVFPENDEECFSYGQCTFFDLCETGITREELDEMALDAWNPLAYTKAEPEIMPAETVAVNAEGDVAHGIKLWETRNV